jgi:predicted nuclease of predicted toxin-antitoxin system
MTAIPFKRVRIYADESVNITIVEGLKRRGIPVFYAKDIGKLGITDEQQLETAIQKRAAIFMHDTDLIRIALHRNHNGIIYVHKQKLTIGEITKRLKIIAETKTRQEMQKQIIFL